MQYHVAREGQTLGQFSEEEIRAGLFDGTYLPTDLGWRDGQGDWAPLSELFPKAAPVSLSKKPTAAPAKPLAASVAPEYHSPTNGLAVTSLVLGIICLFTCGIVGVGAIITIILGHMALSKVRQSHGQLGGKGMAVAGLVMGYISLVLAAVTVVATFASISVPVFSRIQERGNSVKSMNNVQQLITACRLYASDNGGAYPASLDELVTGAYIEPDTLATIQRCPLSPDEPVTGYDYYGAGMKESDSPDAVMFMSKADVNGKRIIGYNDSSVMLAFPGGSRESETSQ